MSSTIFSSTERMKIVKGKVTGSSACRHTRHRVDPGWGTCSLFSLMPIFCSGSYIEIYMGAKVTCIHNSRKLPDRPRATVQNTCLSGHLIVYVMSIPRWTFLACSSYLLIWSTWYTLMLLWKKLLYPCTLKFVLASRIKWLGGLCTARGWDCPHPKL